MVGQFGRRFTRCIQAQTAEAIELPIRRATSIQADRRDDFDALMKLQSIIGARPVPLPYRRHDPKTPLQARCRRCHAAPETDSSAKTIQHNPQRNERRPVHLAGRINQRSIEGGMACVSFTEAPDIRLRDRTLPKSAPTRPPTIHPRPRSRGPCLEFGTSGSASTRAREHRFGRSHR